MYDLIGDIHGHARELETLLTRMDYREVHGVFRHPERQAIFLGDFIDRGPDIRRVIQITRSMIEGGHALAVMGNHEWNALAFHTPDQSRPGSFLRPQVPKNIRQHQATLDQLSSTEMTEALAWFRTLPLWLERDGLRAVHACWNAPSQQHLLSRLDGGNIITDRLLLHGSDESSAEFAALETILKGQEIPLPPGVSFTDKDGHVRTRMRTRWYADPAGQTYRSYALSNEIECDQPLREDVRAVLKPYPVADLPVFVGHYWLRSPRPSPLAANVACLDYSVAKDGLLCAYRWDGETSLHDDHFIWTPSV